MRHSLSVTLYCLLSIVAIAIKLTMNKRIRFILMLLFAAASWQVAKANNAAAGAIAYTWISDSTYRVVYKLYNDCTGKPAPNTVTLCVYNNCNTNSFSTTMQKVVGNIGSGAANGSEIPIACTPTKPTKCTDVNSVLPGLREWWYADTVTLPSRCNSWKFRVAVDKRITTHNYDTANLLVEASLNNQISLQNSSPQFSIRPTLFVCLNQPFFTNLNATDTDGDSLDFSIVNPVTDSTINCTTTSYNLPAKITTPPINFNNNPIQTNNSFTLNNSTGSIGFTATSDSGYNALTIKTNEYRNGILIGSTLTDMFVYVFRCSNGAVPQLDTYKARRFYIDSIKGGAQRDTLFPGFTACVGTQLDYYFPFRAADSTSLLIIRDNAAASLPGATVTYANQISNKVNVHIRWTPGTNDVGWRNIKFFITDTACRPPGIYLTYEMTVDVYVPSGVSLGNDTAICIHEFVGLKPKNPGFWNGDYIWEILPGGSGILSCTNCAGTLAKPTPNASVVLTSSASWCAQQYKDTINLSLLSTPVTYPSVNIITNPGNQVWEYLEVNFRANSYNCARPNYQWMKNGKDIAGATANIYSTTTLKDRDTITCRLICNDTCPNPRDIVSNAIVMNVATSANELAKKKGINIYPSPVDDILVIDMPAIKDPTLYHTTISDVMGRVILSSELSVGKNTIDVSTLVSGMYIVDITSDYQPYMVSKILKR